MYEVLSDVTLFAGAGLAIVLLVQAWRHRGVPETSDRRLMWLMFALTAASWLFGHL